MYTRISLIFESLEFEIYLYFGACNLLFIYNLVHVFCDF